MKPCLRDFTLAGMDGETFLGCHLLGNPFGTVSSYSHQNQRRTGPKFVQRKKGNNSNGIAHLKITMKDPMIVVIYNLQVSSEFFLLRSI